MNSTRSIAFWTVLGVVTLSSGCHPTIMIPEEVLLEEANAPGSMNSESSVRDPNRTATSLKWAENSPTNHSSIAARWTPSSSLTIKKQTIEAFVDDHCLNSAGAEEKLLSGNTDSWSLEVVDGNTYTFHVTTQDHSGQITVSDCSPALVVDRTPPSVSIDAATTQATPTNSLPIVYNVTFSTTIDPVSFTAADITQVGTATGVTWQVTDSGDHRFYLLSASAISSPGTIVPSIAADRVLDLAGNENPASPAAGSVIYDNMPVAVTINQASTQSDPIATLPVVFDVVFSKPINTATFVAGDIGQTGTATGVTWEITNPSNDGRTFVLAATAATGGTLQPTLAAQKVLDAAGNDNLASTSTDPIVNYEIVPPAVLGLTDDAIPGQSKSWSWSCDRPPCSYRYVIDQAVGTVPTGIYGAATSALQSSGDGTYYLHIQAKDFLGNVSAVVSISAVLDNTAPVSPGGLALLSPATTPNIVATPAVRVSGVSNGDTVSLYMDSACSLPGLRASGVANGSSIDLVSSVLANGAYSFYARAVDPSGNASGCSSAMVDYELDTTTVSITGLSNDATAKKSKTWNWGCNKANCTYRYLVDQLAGTPPSGAYGDSTSANQNSGDGTYYLQVQAMDSAGNESDVTTVSAVLDNTAPSQASTLSLVTPASTPGNVVTPAIQIGGLTSGDAVELHADAACLNLKASGTAAGTTLDLTSSALSDGTYSFYAKTTDSAGNTLGCSTAHVDYAVDTAAVTVTDLSDDSTAANTKTWSWGCNKPSCTYRTVIDQEAGTAPSGSYASVTTDTQNSGTGIYYIHVQAQDAAGNESAVRTVSALLDNTGPTAPSGLALISPASSPSTQTTPTIRVSGLGVGDTVELHGNSNCTALKAAGTSTGASFDLTSSGLSEGNTIFYARSLDPSGNVSSCSTASVSYTADQTSPSAPAAVACGTLYNALGSSPAISWGAASDAYGIGKYQVGIGTTNTTPDIATWADQGTDLTTAIHSLSLTTGTTYYCLVRAVDVAGNTSSVASSNWTVDAVLPSQPGAISYTPSGSTAGWFYSASITPVFNWGASTDSSGIARYEVAIGISSGGTEVVDWTTNGTATTKQFSSLSLASGTTYYFSVQAIDNAGNASTPAQTSWTVDTVAPTAPGSVNDGTSLANLTQSPSISWTASSEPISGIDHYEVAIGTTAGATDTKNWASVGDVTSTTVTGLSLTAGTTYYASSRAIDRAGNTSNVGQGNGWVAQTPDPCTGTPVIGTACIGGALYAGQFSGGKYMVTPSGCTNSTSPTCAGGVDTVTKTWVGSGSSVDSIFMTNVATAETPSSQLGSSNTYQIATYVDSTNSAAAYCHNMVYGGYSDWYLPSKSELAYLYCHSSSGGTHNVAYPRENPNCTSYGGRTYELTGFAQSGYWSSTEMDATHAWIEYFSNGNQLAPLKSGGYYVHCVRRY